MEGLALEMLFKATGLDAPSRPCMWLKKERGPKGSLHDMKGAPQHLKVGKSRRSNKKD